MFLPACFVNVQTGQIEPFPLRNAMSQNRGWSWQNRFAVECAHRSWQHSDLCNQQLWKQATCCVGSGAMQLPAGADASGDEWSGSHSDSYTWIRLPHMVFCREVEQFLRDLLPIDRCNRPLAVLTPTRYEGRWGVMVCQQMIPLWLGDV